MNHQLPPPPSSTNLRLPVVLVKAKSAYALWFKALADFPKSYRHNLGGKVDGYFLELLENIFVSLYLSGDHKINRLTISISKLDGVKFFLQLAWENKCLATNQYSLLSSQLDEIGKMLGGWRKGLENKTPPK